MEDVHKISHLRVTIKENIPLLKVNRDAPSTEGLAIEGPLAFILSVLSSHLNFTYNLMEPNDRQAGMKLADGNWTGSMGLVHRNHADFYLGTVAVTHSRTEVLDFTSTFACFQRMFLVGRLEKSGIEYFSFFAAFDLEVFLYVFLVFQAFVFSLCFFGYVAREVKPNSIFVNQWILLHILLGKATNERTFRVSTPRRIIFSTWMMSALIFSFFISGFLVSKMSVSDKDKFMETIEDFLRYPKVWPVVKAGQVDVDIIKNTRGSAFEEVQRRLISKYNSLGILKSKAIFDNPTVLTMINDGQAAFGSNLLNFKLLLDKRYDFLGTNSCYFHLTESYAYTVNALGFRKGFDPFFINVVSDKLEQIVSVGLSRYIYPPPLNHFERCLTLQRSQASEAYAVFTLKNFAGPLNIWVVGMLASVIVIIFEITVSKTYTLLRNLYHSRCRKDEVNDSPYDQKLTATQIQKAVLVEKRASSYIIGLRFNGSENKTTATRHESK